MMGLPKRRGDHHEEAVSEERGRDEGTSAPG